MKMTTTTLEILKNRFTLNINLTMLTHSLNKTEPDNEPVSLEQILDSNGISDAVWALQLFEYKTYCLFLADIAESILPLFQGKNEYYEKNKYYEKDKDYNLARELIQSIEGHHAGEVSKEGLKEAVKMAEKNLSCNYMLEHCITLFATIAYLENMFPYFVIYVAMDINPNLKWAAVETVFRKHFCEDQK